MKRVRPGLAFYVVTSRGYSIGIVRQSFAIMGDLVWMALGPWAEAPTIDDVGGVTGWDWPTFIMVGSQLSVKKISKIGYGLVPSSIEEIPRMRVYGQHDKWYEVEILPDGLARRVNEQTMNFSLPVYENLDSSSLARRLENGYRPTDTV